LENSFLRVQQYASAITDYYWRLVTTNWLAQHSLGGEAMNINKIAKTISVIAIVAAAIFGTFSLLLLFGGNSQMSNTPNTLCFVSLFVWGVAFVVMRFNQKST
jgi:hypothetical protein